MPISAAVRESQQNQESRQKILFQKKEDLEALLDDDFDGSLTLGDIGALLGKTREAVRQNIKALGKEKWYKERRALYTINKQDKCTQLDTARQQLCSVVYQYILQRGEDGAAVATLHCYQTMNFRLEFTSIYGFFCSYQQYLKQGKKVSLLRLARESSLSPVTIRRLLRASGLSRLGNDYHKLSWESKSRLARGRKLSLSAADIAYFVGVKDHSARHFLSRCSRSVLPGQGFYQGHLTYRAASQIYEAADAGFTVLQMFEYFRNQFSPVTITRALDRRADIEPRIVQALQVLYPEKNIIKSHLTQ